MRRTLIGAFALSVLMGAAAMVAPSAGAAAGTLNLTSICTYADGPYVNQHLWRVTSTFAADEPYTSQSPTSAPPEARVATPNRSWFLGVAATTRISYTNDNGAQQVVKAANASTCTSLSATIATPPNGATYAQGDVVGADFTCDGNELVSCVGTVADGASIDTATIGSETFDVTATSWDGSTASAMHSYTVTGPGTPAVDGCKNSALPGAEISQYPAQPGAQSSLRVSCTFNNNPGTSQIASRFTIHDFDVAQFHNGAARTVTATAAVASGATTFTVASCQGLTGWVNRGITAVGAVPGIPARTFVRSVSGACLVTLSGPTTAVIPAGTSFKLDNAPGPRSREDAALTAGSATITSATANFKAADVGLSVSGTLIPADSTIVAVANATTATMSANATATGAGQTVAIGATYSGSTTRQVNDAQNASATVVSSAAAKFKTDDVGLPITGPGIPANTYILSVAGSNATTTGGLTVDAGPNTIVVGDPSATAPQSSDTAGTLGVQLDLDPTLVAGSNACAADDAEGLVLTARWNNPGSFAGSPLFNTQPADSKAIGQVYFDSAIADFSAFVIERPALSAGDPVLTAHYDLVFPNVPVTAVMCPGTASSPGLGFSLGVQGQTLSQAALPAGTGRPGTAQLRAIRSVGSGGYLSRAFVESDDPLITLAPAAEFNRLCIYPPGPAQVSFKCGNG